MQVLSAGILSAQLPDFLPISSECGIEEIADISDFFGNGIAAADFDNDGDIDLYLATEMGIADRLYQNDGFGQFQDIAQQSGIQEMRSNRAALWFDYNGDHLLDLVVAGEACINQICENPILITLYRQLPGSIFEDVTEESNIRAGTSFENLPFYGVGGIAAADFDQDGYLDLVLTVWGGGLRYLHNNGDGTFREFTSEAGLLTEEMNYWQCMMHDFNEDGRIDMYCNVDFNDNQLWINKGTTFENQTDKYGLGSAFNEMGMAMGDLDNDGDLDVYATNITRDFQGLPQHNILYRNEINKGQAGFLELSVSLGVSQSGWDWGTTFIDINNDGRQDLATTNGWNDPFWTKDQSHLWLNTEAGFVEVSESCGFNDWLSATTLLAVDFDRDGDLDIIQSLKDNEETNAPFLVYRNQLEATSTANHYIVLKPRMPGTNHFAIGSKVTVFADHFRSARVVTAGTSFYGQEPAEAFFGLGTLQTVDEVEVRWPNGITTYYLNPAVDRVHVLDYENIAPPAGLELDTVGGKAGLMWEDKSDNETGFLIHRSPDSLFSTYQSYTVAAGVTGFVDGDYDFIGTAYYRVRAFNAHVASAYSNILSTEGFTLPPGPGIPDGRFVFYPNPGPGQFTIKMPSLVTGDVTITLIDRTGSKRYTRTYNFLQPTAQLTEEIEVPDGVYLMHILMEEADEWIKVIVLH